MPDGLRDDHEGEHGPDGGAPEGDEVVRDGERDVDEGQAGHGEAEGAHGAEAAFDDLWWSG